MKKTTNIIYPAFALFAFACFGLFSRAQADDENLGGGNSGAGFNALLSLSGGGFNSAFGWNSQFLLTNGFYNTAFGAGSLALNNADSNTAVGAAALLLKGIGSNNIYIGDPGFAGDNNVIAIGGIAASGTPYTDAFIGGVYNTVVTDRIVYIAADGHLGTLASSRRYKDEIKPMDKASEALFSLQPVTFRYKQQIDPSQKLSFGLIAEEVAKVSPELISRDKEGKPQTVRYEAVNAMLLNEFLKEHRTVQAQQKEIEALRAELKEQRALIQKVNDRVELNRAAPQTVVNNQ